MNLNSFVMLSLAFALGVSGCADTLRTQHVPDAHSKPQRILCGSPALAEIVFALDAGDRVAGVSDFTEYPPEAAAKPSIGGWINPNKERILALQPDLVLSQGKHETLAALCQANAIPFHSYSLDSIDDIFHAITEIARVLDTPDAGQALRTRMQHDLDHLADKYAARPAPAVLVVFGRVPGTMAGLSTIGPDTYLHELLTLAGGSNIFSDASGAFPVISKEAILARNPEVIIELQPGAQDEAKLHMLRADWEPWNTLRAVQNNRIYFLTDNYMLMPGPRMPEAARRMAEALYPEEPLP